ncbi:3-oxoacyl-[acyl-carrier-protein] reductase FabG-like [Haliotis asinina]|uniref:3-oxoacyl-[acyl-carrier-protein] reductase FabG-like n=1 Tax=Haliotis asinina TaxID=109174 RepID=UPI003531D715
MANFAGRVVLITGASAGLGEGTALHFAKKGAKLSLTGRDTTRLEGVAKRCLECEIPDGDILTLTGDLTDAAFRKTTIEKTVAKFGRLVVLVNNAGLVFPGESMGMSETQFDQTMDLNMKAPFLLSQVAVPHLEKTQGNIVNITSLSGNRAFLEDQETVNPLGRLRTPQDVAEAIGYLAFDAASYVTGQIHLVDGGGGCAFK